MSFLYNNKVNFPLFVFGIVFNKYKL